MNLEAMNIDAFLISDFYNKKYYSDFTGSTSEVILGTKDSYFITDGRYQTQSRAEVNPEFEIVFTKTPTSYFDKVVEVIQDAGFRKIGVEGNKITLDYFQKLQSALPDVEFEQFIGVIEEEREVKSPEEIEKIKVAVAITDKMFTEILPQIKEGMTEKELALLVDNTHNKLGGDYPSFQTIAAFGENTAKPHARPSDRKLKDGDIITIDCGTFKNGYCSDMTRTFFFGKTGKAQEELIKLHEMVLEAMQLQIEALAPGKKYSDIDAIGRKFFKERGYDQYFVHGTGHGIGLEIHEAPTLGAVSKGHLRSGNVVTIEPGLYIEGLGGVRIENDVVVTDSGYEVLTTSNRDYNILNEVK